MGKYWRLPESVTLLEVTFKHLTAGNTLMIGYTGYNEYGWHGRTVWYYINGDSIWQLIHIPYEDGVEYRFYEDGEQIKYVKKNCAYIIDMTVIDLIKAYTGNSQFHHEAGTLQLREGELIYEKSLSQTINEYYFTETWGLLQLLRDRYRCKSVVDAFNMFWNDPYYFSDITSDPIRAYAAQTRRRTGNVSRLFFQLKKGQTECFSAPFALICGKFMLPAPARCPLLNPQRFQFPRRAAPYPG